MKYDKGRYRGEEAIHSSIFRPFFRWLLAILSAHLRNILNSQSHFGVKIPIKQSIRYQKRRSTLISRKIFSYELSSDGGRHKFSTVMTAFSFGDRKSKSIICPPSPAITKNQDHSPLHPAFFALPSSIFLSFRHSKFWAQIWRKSETF